MKVTDITGGIREENIREQDLIIDPAKRTGPKPGFHSKAMQDHEVGMARSDCYNAAKHASEIFAQLRHVSETAGIPGWVASKITLAADYLNTVNDYLAGQSVQRDAGVVDEAGAGNLFNTKQQVIDYFIKRGKTAAQGASAWDRGWRGSKPKKSTPTAPTRSYHDDLDDKRYGEYNVSEHNSKKSSSTTKTFDIRNDLGGGKIVFNTTPGRNGKFEIYSSEYFDQTGKLKFKYLFEFGKKKWFDEKEPSGIPYHEKTSEQEMMEKFNNAVITNMIEHYGRILMAQDEKYNRTLEISKRINMKESENKQIENYRSAIQAELKPAMDYFKWIIENSVKFSQNSDIQDVTEESKKMKNDPCWKGYEQIGMKEKNGRQVPNCVPKKRKSK
jgi:hypothetical protein